MKPSMPEFRVGVGSLFKLTGKDPDRRSIHALREFVAFMTNAFE